MAQTAGVSIATVSRALNGGAEINEATRAAVLRVAQDLGYVASARGRGLVSGRTDTVAALIGSEHWPVFLNPFYGEVLAGVELELEARGLALLLSSLKRDAPLLDFAAAQRADGLLVIGHGLPLALLREMGRHLPVVLIDRAEEGFPSVTSEQRDASAALTRCLIERGCTRLAFLAEDLGNPNFHERFLGFRDALEEAGLTLNPAWVQAAAPRAGGGYTALRRLLDAGEVPDGVVGANDPVALEAIRALLEAGLRVPGDVQVVGFDGLPDRLHLMSLTTMRVDRLELGRQGVRLLLEQPAPPRQVQLRPTLLPGASVQPIPGKGDQV